MPQEQPQPQPPPEQPQSPADQFSDPEMGQLQRYGQAMGGVTPFDEEVEKELPHLHPGEKPQPPLQEASAKKMRAAQTGGSTGLGPTEAEAALAKQRGMLQQQAAAQGQQQATQAQAQQTSPTPPPAPSGPQGVTQPYPAEEKS